MRIRITDDCVDTKHFSGIKDNQMFLQFLFTAFFYSLPVFAVIGLYKKSQRTLGWYFQGRQ
jgi:hypothetical protein